MISTSRRDAHHARLRFVIVGSVCLCLLVLGSAESIAKGLNGDSPQGQSCGGATCSASGNALLQLRSRQQRRDTSHLQSDAENELLESKSRTLDEEIQSYADKLEPGATRDFLKILRLCAPCQKYERWGENYDGGYVMCADGLDQGLVGAYSYGINGFDGWGMAVASKYHLPLHEYDCTNSNRPQVCEGCDVTFHGECIQENGAEHKDGFKTLLQQLQESGNGNAAERSLLLKIDVEAAEWKVFAEEPAENLRKFREIVVEYHWLNQEEHHPLYLQAVRKLEEAGFAVTHLHGNNYGGDMFVSGEYSIPNVIEATYIQKPESGCAADIPYHVPLDMPNNGQRPEEPDAVLPSNL